MTMNLYATQQSVLNYLLAEGDFAVYDTDYPEATDEPVSNNGYPAAYAVVRFNDAVKVPQKGAVGGPRHDELYSLVDVLCVGPTPEDARELAYGPDGVADILTGFVPVDAGAMGRESGGQVFVRGDGTGTLPRRFIAICSFRSLVNMVVDE